ncbi:MAG: HD-GYP domain-containing protein [Syntrophales bacterium]
MDKNRVSNFITGLLTFWKPSLGRRMTIAFTIFGLLIGYLTFITLTMTFTRDFTSFSGRIMEERLRAMTQPGGRDRLLSLVNVQRGDIQDTIRVAKHLFLRLYTLSRFNLYVQGGAGDKWREIYVDKDNVFRTRDVDDPGLVSELQRCLYTKTILKGQGVFWGGQDTITFMSDITRPGDNHRYILNLQVNRLGIVALFNRNVYKFLAFGLLLLLVSHLLGHLFSSFLARPIISLAREAEVMATGDFDRVFHTREKNEIGTLAAALNSLVARVRTDIREREELLLGTLLALTRSIDAKSHWTAGHSERVTEHAERLAVALQMDEKTRKELKIAAVLHDIGKIAVPGRILDKEGRLSGEEYGLVKEHPQIGADIIADIPAYEAVRPAILYHHEHWDGSGYPEGLKGEDIPFLARILTIADVYDALLEDRPYRKGLGREEIRAYYEAEKGKLFDPKLAEVFIRSLLSKSGEDDQ